MADITNQQVLDGITELISGVVDNMVTKDDLKEELKRFPTKDELKQELERFPTKDELKQELKRFATKNDLGEMEARLSRKLDSHKRVNVQHHLATRDEIGHLHHEFDNLLENTVLKKPH